MLARIVDPMRELRARRYCPGWIVRKAQINQIDMFFGRLGHEIVFRCAGQIQNSFVIAVSPCRTAVASHHICVDVNRIDRIGDGDLVLIAEDIENETAIAF